MSKLATKSLSVIRTLLDSGVTEQTRAFAERMVQELEEEILKEDSVGLTYVLQDTEVKLTGRKAKKDLPGGGAALVVEVTPVHEASGTWLKWVSEKALMQISQ